MSDLSLYQQIQSSKEFLPKEFYAIPKAITDNIKYPLFDWQQNALENLLIFNNKQAKEGNNKATHLLFNMATGAGKTLLMASCILYYYQKGYRHFLFFVNATSIVDKTENNFIDSTHGKYLFKDTIVIDDKTVTINKVDTFSENPQGIEIKFTSVQKFYNDIHLEKENINTLEDLNKLNLVLLGDEAHHLNANTKNIQIQPDMLELKGNANIKEKLGWEHTVIEYVLKPNPNNVLLEFTATVPSNKEVQAKYQDKIIAKFDLKQFLQAGYTKEINLLAGDYSKQHFMLQSLLFAWYRHNIALKHGIANFKAVTLFRNKDIATSRADFEEFLQLTSRINHQDIAKLLSDLQRVMANSTNSENTSINEMGGSRIAQILAFISKNNIHNAQIANWIQQNYTEKNCIITNSKTNKTKSEKTDEDTEKLLNNLESKNNHIRAIFTVQRLTEGWDVLNLFDIVRLDRGQNAGGSGNKSPEATVQEKQLIGRGVRYFPFIYQDKLKNKRKFDDDLDNELRVLEELYFHTFDEKARYISHLKEELKRDGYISSDNDKVVKTFDLKENFKKEKLFQVGSIWLNTKQKNPYRRKQNLEELKQSLEFNKNLASGNLQEQELNFDKEQDKEKLTTKQDLRTITIKVKDINHHLFRKAINKKAKADNSLFQFCNLSQELAISSIDDLQQGQFLGDCELNLVVNNDIENFDELTGGQKLQTVLEFLSKVEKELKQVVSPNIGSREFIKKPFKEVFGKAKTKVINPQLLDNNVVNNSWYVLDNFAGNELEKELINFLSNTIGDLQKKYDDIYLLRNEEVYKIYDFEQGRGFQPDFLLFLKGKNNDIQYQIFIEPKGEHLVETDTWKAEFLQQIQAKYGFDNILNIDSKNYTLIGLPFYNQANLTDFSKDYKKLYAN